MCVYLINIPDSAYASGQYTCKWIELELGGIRCNDLRISDLCMVHNAHANVHKHNIINTH